MIKKVSVLFLALYSILIFCSPLAIADDRYWWMTSTDKYSTWFDTQTIKYTKTNGTVNKNVIDVWIKYTYNQNGIDDRIQRRQKAGFSVDGYENLSHSLAHHLFDISNNSIKDLYFVDYDNKGNIIYAFSPSGAWDTIIPNSQGEKWIRVLKNYASNNSSLLESR